MNSKLAGTDLNWTLAGYTYLGDGLERGTYKLSLAFSGGMKKIFPGM